MRANGRDNGDIWVLVVDDDLDVRSFFVSFLNRQGFKVDSVAKGQDAIDFLASNDPDAVLLDLRLPDIDGITVLRKMRELRPNAAAIVMTGYATVKSSVEAMKLGAWNYHVKPLDEPAEISTEIREAVMGKRKPPSRPAPGQQKAHGISPFLVGDSPQLKQVLDLASRAAEVDSSVLICGESGTGKELVAKLIHANCPRSKGKFLAVNCGAVADSLLESTLFGYERGAFTGAYRRTKGYFEAADGGTLFLDEIADTSLQLQAKLLRTLEERAFQRVGGVDTVFTDVRIIAATNRNLKEEVAASRFREDLYYRINVLNINIPPLRERIKDVRPLAKYFLKKHSGEFLKKHSGKEDDQHKRFSEEAIKTLESYSWPGNVRELENIVERALAFGAGSGPIGLESLPPNLAREDRTTPSAASDSLTLAAAREEFERRYIARVLRESDGNVSAAARTAGIARQNLYAKIRKYGLDLDRG
jgi:DNA-binding NtrC family response regulator